MAKKQQQYKRPKRAISGIFLLDKAKGLSSNAVMQQVKHCFEAEKAGHTGALDPMATGLLPVCLGEATKFSHYLLDADKSYQATIKLGSQTDTGDADGNIINQKPVPTLSLTHINSVLQEFMGAQEQIPPMYSALKKDGKKLYELARAGEIVERPARPIHISQLTLISHTNNVTNNVANDELNISVTCSKGTYIRVLGEDIAHALGTLGHLTALRRTQTGCFKLENAMRFDALSNIATITEKDALLLPSYASIAHFPRVELDESQVKRIQFGQRLNLKAQADKLFLAQHTTNAEKNTLDVLMFAENNCHGLGILENTGRLQPKRLIKQP